MAIVPGCDAPGPTPVIGARGAGMQGGDGGGTPPGGRFRGRWAGVRGGARRDREPRARKTRALRRRTESGARRDQEPRARRTRVLRRRTEPGARRGREPRARRTRAPLRRAESGARSGRLVARWPPRVHGCPGGQPEFRWPRRAMAGRCSRSSPWGAVIATSSTAYLAPSPAASGSSPRLVAG